MKNLFWYILIMLLFMVTLGNSQDDPNMAKQYNHKLRMNIEIRDFEGKLLPALKDTEVIWGTDEADTTTFLFAEKLYSYYPVAAKTWKRLPEPKRRYYRQYKGCYLKQDSFNELYCIKFLWSTDFTMMILITNIDFGFPNYILTWPTDNLLATK